MKDQGLNRGLVQDFNTSDKRAKGAFYGFRKMFWTYLNKLHVPFSDPCCDDAGGADISAVRFNKTTGETEYWDGTAWVATTSWVAPTTTTTTAAPTTTTTTTVAPTTTTTTVP